MKSVISNQPNFTLRLTIPFLGSFDAVIDPSCNYSVIPEKVYLKRNFNMVPWYKVLSTNFGKQKVRMTMLYGVKVLDKNIETLEVAIVPGATKAIAGRNLLDALQIKGIHLEYRFNNNNFSNEIQCNQK